MMPKYCKPNTKGRCRYCGVSGRTSQDRCNPGDPRKASGGKEAKRRKEPKAKRTDEQRLELIVNHCSTCDNFQDAQSFNKLKCRRVGSCGCLWSKMESALFGCPIGKFDRAQSIIERYNK